MSRHLEYMGYQRVLRVRMRDQSSVNDEITFPYGAKDAVEHLLEWMRNSFGQVYYDLEYDWLLSDGSRVVRCEYCYQVPGVDEATAYVLRDEGLRDGQYWAEYFTASKLLCSKCQRRQKALRRLLRMRGCTVHGEEVA